MKVDVLVSKYKELKSEEEKQAFILKHIKNNYINYEQKITEVTNIVNIGNHTEIVDPSDSTRTLNIFKRNTPIMYYLLKLTLIRNYSDIELDNNADEGQTLRSYNLLESMGFIDAFIAALPETEVQKYHTILEMMNNDIYTPELDIENLDNIDNMYIGHIYDEYKRTKKFKQLVLYGTIINKGSSLRVKTL